MYQFGSFSLDPDERVVSRNGIALPLTPKAFQLLLCFVHNPGRLITKDELLKEIWPDTFVEEVNLAVNISALRKALGDNPKQCRYISRDDSWMRLSWGRSSKLQTQLNLRNRRSLLLRSFNASACAPRNRARLF